MVGGARRPDDPVGIFGYDAVQDIQLPAKLLVLGKKGRAHARTTFRLIFAVHAAGYSGGSSREATKSGGFHARKRGDSEAGGNRRQAAAGKGIFSRTDRPGSGTQ